MIFVFSGLSCYPQDSVFLSGTQRSFRITFDRSEAPSSVIANEMLKEISADAVKNIRNTGFVLNFGVEINISYSTRNRGYEILFYRNGTAGDDSYREFPLEDVLFPDSIDGELRIIRKNTGVIFSCPALVKPDSAHPGVLRISGDLPAFDPGTDSIVTEGIRLFYTASSLSAFQRRIALINDYYACSFVADTLLAMAGNMDPPQSVKMTRLFIFLEEVNKVVMLIEQRDLDRNLELEISDPLNFRDRFRELFRFSKSASMTFHQRLEDKDIAGERGIPEESYDTFMGIILRHIRWSFQVNEMNSTIYHEFLERFWSLDAFEKDPDIIRQLVSGIYPGMDADSLLREISGGIMGAYRHYAKTLADSGRNAEALELFNNQRLFSADNPWLKEIKTDDSARLPAIRGIYISYLSVASSALANQKPDLADTYLKKALSFKTENLPLDKPDSLYQEIYGQYISLRIRESDTPGGSLASLWYLSGRIRSAESLIWNNHLDEAELFADSLENLAGTGPMKDDSLLAAAIRKYRALISEKICWNTDEAVSVLRIRAERARELKSYPVLCILLDSAITLSERFPECSPGSKEISDTLSKYSVACAYYRMLNDAGNSVVLNQYEDAVKKYYDLADFYKSRRIGSFGIEETSPEEIIRQRSLPLLTLAACRFCEEKNRYSTALAYLKILRLQDYPVKEIKPYQAELAKKMAAEDFGKDPGQDPQAMATLYTGSDKWFSRFRSAYIFEWNKVRNSGSP